MLMASPGNHTGSCASCIGTLSFPVILLLVPAYPDSPGKRAVKRVCVCVSYHIIRVFVLFTRAKVEVIWLDAGLRV